MAVLIKSRGRSGKQSVGVFATKKKNGWNFEESIEDKQDGGSGRKKSKVKARKFSDLIFHHVRGTVKYREDFCETSR